MSLEFLQSLAMMIQQLDLSLSIDYLYDHGWQVKISNPGGSLYVHGGTAIKPEHWCNVTEPSLGETVLHAIEQAKSEGWL
jgi:hypothetical protein